MMLWRKVTRSGWLGVLAGMMLLTGCASGQSRPYVYEAPRAEALQHQDAVARTPQAAAPAPRPVTEPVGEIEAPLEVALPSGYRLQAGDPVAVHLRGIPEASNYEFVLDESGFISLPYISPIQALGRTAPELQRSIHDAYIEEQIYRRISVNVMLSTQSYFVRGEVRQPGRFPLTSGMTLLKAIAAAGGYTEFANPRRVEIIRGDVSRVENARRIEQDPSRDVDIKAGDVIVVRRSIF